MTDTRSITSKRYGARSFDQVGTRPYRKRDGTTGKLVDWRTACVTCGAPFYITTGASKDAHRTTSAFETVHCPAHRTRTTIAAIERHRMLVATYADKPQTYGDTHG